MNDTLSVELEIKDGQANVVLDRFHGRLQDTESAWANLGVSGVRTFDTMGSAAAGASKGVNLTKGQMQQLSFQINDAATMLASGASPFQIMATQGGQVVQVFAT